MVQSPPASGFLGTKKNEIPKMEVAATTVDGSEILRAPVEVGS